MQDEQEFQAVLAAAVRGDEQAWTTLYDWLAPAVVGYLRSRGAHHPDDAASEVFLQIVRDVDGFAGSLSKFRSWVFTITHHRMVDQARALRRRPSEPTDDAALGEMCPAVEWEADAVEDLASEELQRLFRWATADQQEVLVLRFVAGLTLPEIADVLGKRVGAVKALQRRGLAAVSEAVDAGVYPLGRSVALTRV